MTPESAPPGRLRRGFEGLFGGFERVRRVPGPERGVDILANSEV
jgi:hypothetical protein